MSDKHSCRKSHASHNFYQPSQTFSIVRTYKDRACSLALAFLWGVYMLTGFSSRAQFKDMQVCLAGDPKLDVGVNGWMSLYVIPAATLVIRPGCTLPVAM